MLQERELKTFVEGTTNYFEIAAQQPASVGSPYLVTKGKPGVHGYTGVIRVSGKREGIVYFTAPRTMLTVLLMKLKETDFSDATLCDLVGEVANTISGNARRDFGREFVISVPSVLTGDEVEIPMTRDLRPYVIPINWRSHSAKLVVALK
ncbi:MAG TPA: chemotaxis protein CheX [Steroidobacteraceae bacterium]|nr:chemotaxis protein CheX [Steroidobacteraceae bacterium]